MSQSKANDRTVSALTAGILLFLAAMAVLLVLAPSYRRSQLRLAIHRALRMYRIGYASHIQLEDFTDFHWEQLYIFPPDTTPVTIEKTTGDAWPGFIGPHIEGDDSITLLVFVSHGSIVRWVEIPRADGDFSTLAAQSPYTPQTARFFLPDPEKSALQELQ